MWVRVCVRIYTVSGWVFKCMVIIFTLALKISFLKIKLLEI